MFKKLKQFFKGLSCIHQNYSQQIVEYQGIRMRHNTCVDCGHTWDERL